MAPSRIVVVDRIYYQPPNESPRGDALGFSREVLSEETPYTYRPSFKNRGDHPIDVGWLSEGEVGFIVIKNDTKAVIDLLFDGQPAIAVRPGEHERVSIIDYKRWSIGSPLGDERPTVTVYPR